jgi:hypothetical protein
MTGATRATEDAAPSEARGTPGNNPQRLSEQVETAQTMREDVARGTPSLRRRGVPARTGMFRSSGTASG